MSRTGLRAHLKASTIRIAVELLVRRRTPSPQVKKAPPFYSEGFTVVESFCASCVVVLMLMVSLWRADQQMVALGLTMMTAAAFLTTPKLLSNSMLRRLQAQQLQRLAKKAPNELAKSRRSRAVLVLLLLLAGVSLILEVVGTFMMLEHDDPSLTGVVLFVSGVCLLLFVLVVTGLWTMGVTLAEAVVSDAQATEGRVLDSDRSDRAWLIALMLFLIGTVLQFADVVAAG